MLAEKNDVLVLCELDDLIVNAGVGLRYNGEQYALFYLPDTQQKVFAVGNFDPFSKANVISRGIVGSLNDKLVVASPLYKQHFDLLTGECVEEPGVSLPTLPVSLVDGQVVI